MSGLLQDWVAHQAQTRPDALAVIGGSERVTYGHLDAQSNQLARALKDAGCRRGDRVAVLMPKSPTAIVAILGIYKADCIFVPLDRSSPPVRLAKILNSCDSACLLAAGPVLDTLDRICGTELTHARPFVGWLDAGRPSLSHAEVRFALDDLSTYREVPPASTNTPAAAAHILFTSGSTGTPKGVVISHTNVIAFVEWAGRHFGISSSDRLSGHSPLHFDLSTFDIFGTFQAGAQLHLVPAEISPFPSAVAEFIRTSELTQWFSVPSVLNYLAKFDVVRRHDFPALRRLLWCGEVLPTPALMYWMERLPHVGFTNLYGPTETTIASAYYTVPRCPGDPLEQVPIGTACDGEELLVLNDSLDRLPPGDVGELYIKGAGLSPGYWNAGELTAAAFLTDPHRPSDRLYKTGDLVRVGPDGLVYFLGRADAQIKSRGYRIEPGEIEAALSAIAAVQEAAIVGMTTDGFEGTLIACAYAPAPSCSLSPADLRKALSALVPPYMLPSRWLILPSLPKNASGKIDRRALRELFAGSEAVTA